MVKCNHVLKELNWRMKRQMTAKLLAVATTLLISHLSAFAQFVTINLDADQLKTAGGTAMPTTGLVMLIASTTDTSFGAPIPSAFVTGDDVILWTWSLDSGFGAGVFSDKVENLQLGSPSISTEWGSGDRLEMLWFPDLTIGDASPGEGTSYGRYRDPATSGSGTDGSALWVTPGEGATISLRFLMTDGIVSPGTVAASAGLASFTVVPEPAEYAVIFGAACLLAALARKKLFPQSQGSAEHGALRVETPACTATGCAAR